MDSELKQQLRSGSVWRRALYMVLFSFFYMVAEFVLTFVVLFQFVSVLFSGETNAKLLRLGGELSRYIYQIVRFLSFNSEQHVYPFAEWPNSSRYDDERDEHELEAVVSDNDNDGC